MGQFHSILREWVGAQRSALSALCNHCVETSCSYGKEQSWSTTFQNFERCRVFRSLGRLGGRSRLFYHKARFNWHNWGGVGAVKGFHITANSHHNCLRHVYSIEAEEKKMSVIPRRRVTGLWMAPTYRHTMQPCQPTLLPRQVLGVAIGSRMPHCGFSHGSMDSPT